MGNIKYFLKNSSVEKIFLFLSIPTILLFIVFIPALEGWDESTHFLRAYQVSTGQFSPTTYGKQAGGPIPVNVSGLSDSALGDLVMSAQTGLKRKAHLGYYVTYIKENHPSKNIVNKIFSTSAVYSPVSYAPQAVGIYLARTLRLPLLSYVFIGRIFNAAAFIALVYFAIRLIPRGKWVLLAIAMLPTTLTAAASLSPDALVNASALLLAALFVNGFLRKKPFEIKHLAALTGTILLLSLAKETYFVLAFLPLFLPVRSFGTVKKFWLWNLIFIFLALATSLAWYSKVSTIAKYSYLDNRPTQNISPPNQESYMLHHPLHYLGTLSWEVLGRSNPEYLQLTGEYTWKGIMMPDYMIYVIYLGLILAFVATRQEAEIEPKARLSVWQKRRTAYGPILIAAAMVVLIYTSFYLYFTEVGAPHIEGVQGRYFIPLIGLILPAAILTAKRKPAVMLNKEKVPLVLGSIFITQCVIAFVIIVFTNYIPHIQFV